MMGCPCGRPVQAGVSLDVPCSLPEASQVLIPGSQGREELEPRSSARGGLFPRVRVTEALGSSGGTNEMAHKPLRHSPGGDLPV